MRPLSFACVAVLTTLAFGPNVGWAQMYFNGPIFSRGSTVAGDFWRGGGTYMYGRDALEAGYGLHWAGAGKYLESLGRYQIGNEQAREMAIRNHYDLQERELRYKPL